MEKLLNLQRICQDWARCRKRANRLRMRKHPKKIRVVCEESGHSSVRLSFSAVWLALYLITRHMQVCVRRFRFDNVFDDFEFDEGVLVIGEFELMTRAVDKTAIAGSDTESYFKIYAGAG
jgi:hypothetical protein